MRHPEGKARKGEMEERKEILLKYCTKGRLAFSGDIRRSNEDDSCNEGRK